MLGAAMQRAGADAVQGRAFTAPSGRVYRWKEAGEPTQADVDRLVSWENGLVQREKSEQVRLDIKGNVVGYEAHYGSQDVGKGRSDGNGRPALSDAYDSYLHAGGGSDDVMSSMLSSKRARIRQAAASAQGAQDAGAVAEVTAGTNRFNEGVGQVAAGIAAGSFPLLDKVFPSAVRAGAKTVAAMVNPVSYAALPVNLVNDPAGTWEGLKRSFSAAFDPQAPAEERIMSALNWVLTLAPLLPKGVKMFKALREVMPVGEIAAAIDEAASVLGSKRAKGLPGVAHAQEVLSDLWDLSVGGGKSQRRATAKLEGAEDAGPGNLKSEIGDLKENEGAARPAETPKALGKLMPDDPRLDPTSDLYDHRVADAAYRHNVGNEPELEVWSEDPALTVDAHEALVSRLEEMRNQELVQEVNQADLDLLHEMRKGVRTRTGPSGLIRVFRKRGGPWRQDARSRTSWIRVGSLFEPFDAKRIVEYALSRGDSDVLYATQSDWDRHIRLGEKLRARRASEIIEAEQSLVDMTAESEYGVHKNTMVPRQALVDYIADIRGRIETQKLAAAAAEIGVTDEELQAAIRFYESEGRAARGQDAAGRPNADAGVADGGASKVGPAEGQASEAGGVSGFRSSDSQHSGGATRPGTSGGAEGAVGTLSGLNKGRSVSWRGKIRSFVDYFEVGLYDQVSGEGRKAIRDLEKQFGAATDPAERQRLNELISIERRNHAENVDDFFDWQDRRSKGAAKEAAIESGSEVDLDGAFARVTEEVRSSLSDVSDVSDVSAAGSEIGAEGSKAIKGRIQRRMDAGFTRLPVGDLHALARDFTELAKRALEAGSERLAWVGEMVGRFGEAARDFAVRAWRTANEVFRMEPSYPGFRQRGALGPKAGKGKGSENLGSETGDLKEGGASETPAHLQTAERVKAADPGVKRWLRHVFLAGNEPAVAARRALEKVKGENLERTRYDIEMGLNEQTRIGGGIRSMVEGGFTAEDGAKASMGLKEMAEGMAAEGFDYEAWQAYRRALRENELSVRDEAGVIYDQERLDANSAYIHEYLGSEQGAQAARWDAEWQKFADGQLQLREQYGLRAPGWADAIREENQFYWPLAGAADEVELAMRRLNPQKLASPEGQVYPAIGGKAYADGFASAALETERIVRDGELTNALLPFMDEAAKHPELEGLVREVTGTEEATGAVEGRDNVLSLKSLEDGPDGPVSKTRVFKLDPYLWDGLRGHQPQAMNVILQVLRGFGSVSRGATTKYNPLFSLVFNPMIDFASATIIHGQNPLRWLKALYHSAKGEGSALYRDAAQNKVFFESRGTRDFLEQQWIYDPEKLGAVEKIGDRLAQAQGVKLIARGSQIMEETTRLAFYEQMLAKYLKEGFAGKEARRMAAYDAAELMNFGEAGAAGRYGSMAGIPFVNVPSQVLRSIGKGWKRNPYGLMARAVGLITVPGILEYLAYKDDPEWQALPDYIKYGGLNTKIGGQWVSFRLPYELSAVFKGLPLQGLMAYEGSKDFDQAAMDELNLMADAYQPSMMPTALAFLMQEAFYWGGDKMVVDLRFPGRPRSYPLEEEPDEEAQERAGWKMDVQRVDTLLGSLGRLGIKTTGYFLGKEERFPNPLQRYMPQPEVGGRGTSSN